MPKRSQTWCKDWYQWDSHGTGSEKRCKKRWKQKSKKRGPPAHRDPPPQWDFEEIRRQKTRKTVMGCATANIVSFVMAIDFKGRNPEDISEEELIDVASKWAVIFRDDLHGRIQNMRFDRWLLDSLLDLSLDSLLTGHSILDAWSLYHRRPLSICFVCSPTFALSHFISYSFYLLASTAHHPLTSFGGRVFRFFLFLLHSNQSSALAINMRRKGNSADGTSSSASAVSAGADQVVAEQVDEEASADAVDEAQVNEKNIPPRRASPPKLMPKAAPVKRNTEAAESLEEQAAKKSKPRPKPPPGPPPSSIVRGYEKASQQMREKAEEEEETEKEAAGREEAAEDEEEAEEALDGVQWDAGRESEEAGAVWEDGGEWQDEVQAAEKRAVSSSEDSGSAWAAGLAIPKTPPASTGRQPHADRHKSPGELQFEEWAMIPTTPPTAESTDAVGIARESGAAESCSERSCPPPSGFQSRRQSSRNTSTTQSRRPRGISISTANASPVKISNLRKSPCGCCACSDSTWCCHCRRSTSLVQSTTCLV